MRLLIITQYFPPEMGIPQARLFELARRLVDMGHAITVLTAMPNYPAGKIFDGYRGRIKTAETLDGMKVVRTCLYPSKSSRTLPRLFSYLSFGVSSALLGTWGLGKHDIVLIESPPLFLVPFALCTARAVRGKAVLMVSDIWPDILIRMGHASDKSMAVRAMLWLEKYVYKHSHAVALTNPGACRQVRERFPHLRCVTVISNGVDTQLFRPDLRDDLIRQQFGAGPNDFLVGYCGLHGLAQGLETVVDAVELLKDHAHIKFVMVGEGPTKEELVARAAKKHLANLAFYDRRPKSEMPAILASLDASLVPLAGRFPGTMPSKIYEALASGTPPIVAKGCEGEALVAEYGIGRCYEPLDALEMAKAILGLAEERQHVGGVRQACIALSRRFDRGLIAERTEQVLLAIHRNEPLPEVDW